VQAAPGLAVFDTNAYSTSLTGGLTNALQSLPSTGPLDERAVHLTFAEGGAPAGAAVLAARAGTVVAEDQTGANGSRAFFTNVTRSPWIERETRSLVDAISGPTLDTRIAVFACWARCCLGSCMRCRPGTARPLSEPI